MIWLYLQSHSQPFSSLQINGFPKGMASSVRLNEQLKDSNFREIAAHIMPRFQLSKQNALLLIGFCALSSVNVV